MAMSMEYTFEDEAELLEIVSRGDLRVLLYRILAREKVITLMQEANFRSKTVSASNIVFKGNSVSDSAIAEEPKTLTVRHRPLSSESTRQLPVTNAAPMRVKRTGSVGSSSGLDREKRLSEQNLCKLRVEQQMETNLCIKMFREALKNSSDCLQLENESLKREATELREALAKANTQCETLEKDLKAATQKLQSDAEIKRSSAYTFRAPQLSIPVMTTRSHPDSSTPSPDHIPPFPPLSEFAPATPTKRTASLPQVNADWMRFWGEGSENRPRRKWEFKLVREVGVSTSSA
mmetsp:Transcript_11459/g.18694  ORF Transcript_11459/g.18694 Transcript_11459/m.18694 type:complete len:291 (+) Transcript_11459:179-1051(+)